MVFHHRFQYPSYVAETCAYALQHAYCAAGMRALKRRAGAAFDDWHIVEAVFMSSWLSALTRPCQYSQGLASSPQSTSMPGYRMAGFLR